MLESALYCNLLSSIQVRDGWDGWDGWELAGARNAQQTGLSEYHRPHRSHKSRRTHRTHRIFLSGQLPGGQHGGGDKFIAGGRHVGAVARQQHAGFGVAAFGQPFPCEYGIQRNQAGA